MSKAYANEKCVLLLSGGLDSATLLYQLKAQGLTLYALSITYGQKHRKEIEVSKEIAEKVGAIHKIIDLDSTAALLTSSALTNDSIAIPHGHYSDESMKQTVVPNRNMVLLSLATAWAISLNAKYIAYAAHSGDNHTYPDCRPEFAEALSKAISLCDWDPPHLLTPFIKISKSEIVKIGRGLHVPYEMTWSCYEGKELHCGECGSCTARMEAFQLSDVPDPTRYENVLR